MAIIAGLPAPANQAAVRALQAEFPLWKIVTERFPDSYEKTYNFESPVLDLLRAVCSFASAQPERPVPRPAQIMLFYVEAPDSARLLDAFGYSVLPSRLDCEDWHWPQGRHWRIDSNVIEDVLIRAARNMRQEPLEGLRLRLEQPAKDEPLLLPPRNFKPRGQENLVPRFNELLRTANFEGIAFDDLEVKAFDHRNLGAFFRRVPDNYASFRVDARGLVFATSPRGQDGAKWAEDVLALPLSEFRNMMEGLYRFGTSLRSGFQHDVQWANNYLLSNETFYDAETGTEKKISGDHANIFANDNVR